MNSTEDGERCWSFNIKLMKATAVIGVIPLEGDLVSDGVVRILSIDGGGIRGIIPAMVIKALLGDLRAQDTFHIIAGTSTGGIIACGLAKPNPINLDDIINLYVEHGGEIFKKRLIDVGHYFYGPRYGPAALENYLASEFGNTCLSEVTGVELLGRVDGFDPEPCGCDA